MNKTILTIFLSLVTIIIGYLTFRTIYDQIAYDNKVKEINAQVIERLELLRKMQLAYKEVKGDYAKNFDLLFNFMKNEKYYKLKQVGDNDGEVNNAKVDTIFLDPIVEIIGVDKNTANIEKYKFVPPMDTAVFLMDAGRITQNNVSVPVFEISDPHPFDKKEKAKKVGDMYNAVTTGNWK